MTLHVPVSVYPTNLDNIAVVSHILMVPVVDLSQYQVCWHNRRRMKHFVNIAHNSSMLSIFAKFCESLL